MRVAVVIVAAGRGLRAARAGGGPKQYEVIGGQSVLTHTLRAFCDHPAVGQTLAVIHADDADLYAQAVAPVAARSQAGGRLLAPVTGGATRQASVLAGLEALTDDPPDIVLIHDAARPFVAGDIIDRVIAALADHAGAIAALAVSDTLKRSGPDRTIAGTVDRAGLWRAQTPQGFRFAAIIEAHRRAAAAGLSDFTDDAAIAEWAGLPVALVEGSAANVKITTPEDLIAGNRAMTPYPMPRTGLGFDVHAFTEGDRVWLGGVEIPHTHKLEGHSDADVVLHALTDALLGTIGDGDIGQHFPPSDPRWKGAASILFLEDAARRVRERGGRVVNVDVTILAEAPRIGPHRPAMQGVISKALGITPSDVGIKATTMETLGFVGRREGIAAMAVATVLLGG